MQPAAQRKPPTVTVGRLARYLRTQISENPKLQWLGVSGEVSNLRRSGSMLYFDLKDADALLACIAWSEYHPHFPPFENGEAIVAIGAVTTYEKASKYQLEVRDVRLENKFGDLHRRYEELKAKLQAEGLFAEGRKRPLPRFPFRVALVSSRGAQGAGDFLTIMARRSPHVDVVLCETAVQGAGANLEIARAIDRASRLDVDAVVVARGGGSFEDLFPFSTEEVVRAIVRSRVPVIAAIGHEGDTPLADLVADRRASTPSAAAEIVAPERERLLARIEQSGIALARCVRRTLERGASESAKALRYSVVEDPARFFGRKLQRVDAALTAVDMHVRGGETRRVARLAEASRRIERFDPSAQLGLREQRFAVLKYRLPEAYRTGIERRARRSDAVQTGLSEGVVRRALFQAERAMGARRRLQGVHPSAALAEREQGLALLRYRLERQGEKSLAQVQSRLAVSQAKLYGNDPEAILQRGYAIVRQNGSLVRDASAVPAGSRVEAQVARGTLVARVEAVRLDGGD